MRIGYSVLARIRVSHAYWGGACDDLEWLVPGETSRRLGGSGLLARRLGGDLHLLFETGAGGARRLSASGTTLRFGLRLRNPEFASFTAPETPLLQGFSLWRNAAAPGALDEPEGLRLAGDVLRHPLGGVTRPVVLGVQDAAGAELARFTVSEPGASACLELRGLGPGRIAVVEDDGGPPRVTSYYLHPELARAGARGAVEIKIADGFYTASADLVVAFAAREETLRYYVVTRNLSDAEIGQLKVSDQGFGDDGRPEVEFTTPGALPAEPPPALLAADGQKLAVFQSKTPVARRAQGRRKIQLRRNGTPLIENLPQPGAGRRDSNLIVHYTKAK